MLDAIHWLQIWNEYLVDVQMKDFIHVIWTWKMGPVEPFDLSEFQFNPMNSKVQ